MNQHTEELEILILALDVGVLLHADVIQLAYATLLPHNFFL